MFTPETGEFSGTPDDAQVGQITVRVTATDNNSASTFAAFTLTVTPVNDVPTGGVTIATSATEDTTLTAMSTLADADGLGLFTYQWQSSADGLSWTNVGMNSASFTPGDAEVGRAIRVVTTYIDGQGFANTVESNATSATVATNDDPTGAVTIAAMATENTTLTAVSTLADVDGIGPLSYQW
jgi:Putative Ig domain